MECPDCGSTLRDNARFCMQCGAMLMSTVRLTRPVMAPVGWEVEDLNGAIAHRRPSQYLGSASRIPRFIAWFIDQGILAAVNSFLLIATGHGELFERQRYGLEELPTITVKGWVLALMIVIHAAYFVAFTASKWQATPGKKLVSLKVTDANGNRLGLVQSTWRWVCQVFVLAVMVPLGAWATALAGGYIGYTFFGGVFGLVAALVYVLSASNEQSPWDMLAGTRVLE